MKLHRTCFKNTYTICIYGILLISAILPALFAVRYIKISPDSMIYALISQELISGNGIRLPIIRLEDSYVPLNGTIPYLEQPPLLPIFFALLGGVTPQNFLPAQIINVISHVIISIFTFLLMKKLYDNKGIALVTGILVSISFPLLWNVNHMLSESLFIALTVTTLCFLILSRYSESYKSILNLFVASICASAAILTRFPGIALIPVFFWETFILVKNKRIRSKYVSAALATMLPIIITGIFFIRNYIISGTIFGHNEPPPDRSYLDAFTGTIDMIFLQFSLGKRPVALITIFLILFILYILVNSNARRELSKYVHPGLDLIIVFIVSYTTVISIAMTTSQTVFELRYVSPLVPFLFIVSIFGIVFVWKRIKLRGFSKLSLIGIILSLGIITFCNGYKTHLRLGEFSYEHVKPYFILNSSTYKWIKENYGGNIVITTNRPYHLSFFGRYTTIVLPHKRFSPSIRIPNNMDSFLPERMSKFGSQVLALFEEAKKKYDGWYIAQLFNKREDTDKFILVYESPDGVVYHLTENPGFPSQAGE